MEKDVEDHEPSGELIPFSTQEKKSVMTNMSQLLKRCPIQANIMEVSAGAQVNVYHLPGTWHSTRRHVRP